MTEKAESKKKQVLMPQDVKWCHMEDSQKYNFIGQAGGIPHLKGKLQLTWIVFLDPNQGIEVLWGLKGVFFWKNSTPFFLVKQIK